MTKSRVGLPVSALLLISAALVPACGGGGGGGGGSSSSSSSSFLLTDVKYGRLINDGTGDRVVSPLSTVDVDPVTGFVIAGSLLPLASTVDINRLQSLGIGSSYLPRVVPRNGVLVLEFSAVLDPNSVTADVVDSAGTVVTPGTVQLRTEDGKGVQYTVTVMDRTKIRLNGVTATTIGLPASPTDFGPDGQPRADATGFLKLVLPKTGATVMSAGGGALGRRNDKLSDGSTPIGINPGNRVLDFIVENQLIPTNETFNGFLPDLRAPRIVRAFTYTKALSFGSGDSATSTTITDTSARFSNVAQNGAGEWAGKLLTLRPGAPTEEKHSVLSNTGTTVTIIDTFTALPVDGDTYLLSRAEFFEPDPQSPIDPVHFDPNNPENGNNTGLQNFVEAFEIDTAGNVVSGPLPVTQTLPTFSQLTVHFNEPMSKDSFGQWESFAVWFNPDQGLGSEILSQIVLDATQRAVTIRPAREDQSTGTIEVVGWGKATKALQLDITTVPNATYLQQRMSSDQVQAFFDLGVRGITDVGGQPLGFPDSYFNSTTPQIKFVVPFVTDESASTQIPPPVVSSWGVLVHRMQGRPVTGIDPATGNPGVKYQDQANYYMPIADINLQANGFLAGSPVVFVTKVHDDFFPPPDGQFGAFPLGTTIPLASFNTAAGPQPHDGARFQHVYRDVDASPSRDNLAGTLLDLYRVSWCPIGGNVTTDIYDNIAVNAAHSSFRPSTAQNGAAASDPYTGLATPFDFITWENEYSGGGAKCGFIGSCNTVEGPNWYPDPTHASGNAGFDNLVPCVPTGTKYKVTQSSLFAPPFDGRAYHPWPDFVNKFQYNNGDNPQAERDLRTAENNAHLCNGGKVWLEKRGGANQGGDSLMLEYRIHSQSANVSRQNGFTFAIGILIDVFPYFRVWSIGSPMKTINPDNMSDTYARCAKGVKDTGGTFGDNSRYYAVFDYVKTTSRITSPFVRVFPSATTNPDYFPAIVLPQPQDQPAGTTVHLEFQGANNTKGTGGTGFSTDVNIADTRQNLAFRVTFVGNLQSLLLPNFDVVAIPYLRPQGN